MGCGTEEVKHQSQALRDGFLAEVFLLGSLGWIE